MNKKKKALWSKMDELIVSDEITDKESEILLAAKVKLNKNIDDEVVAAQLKSRLQVLSMRRLMSSSVVPFFTELTRLYLGFGRRDNIVITPMF